MSEAIPIRGALKPKPTGIESDAAVIVPELSENHGRWHNTLEHPLLWYDATTLVEDRDDATVMPRLADIDLVVTGHSPGRHPRWARRNVICLDTGFHYDEWGHLTVAEIQGPDLKLHRFARSEDDLNRM